MEQEGFKVGDQVQINAGAVITSSNGAEHIKTLTHHQTVKIEMLLDSHADQPLLICWREHGNWREAKVMDCTVIPASD